MRRVLGSLVARSVATVLAALSVAGTASAADTWNNTWWDPSSGAQVFDAPDVVQAQDIVVLGESHYNPAIHAAQGRIVELFAAAAPARPLTLGWEFLDTRDAAMVAAQWQTFIASREPGEALAARLVGGNGYAYGALFDSLRRAGGTLIATNLSREEKAPVTRGGIGAADPRLVPPGFALGGNDYFDRFNEAMGGGTHPLPYPIENYFAAQCLTDDVMAYALLGGAAADDRRVLITGSFHGDYNDGVVARLAVRSPASRLLYVRILDAAEFTADELRAAFRDARYGNLADLVHVVGEPSAAPVGPTRRVSGLGER